MQKNNIFLQVISLFGLLYCVSAQAQTTGSTAGRVASATTSARGSFGTIPGSYMGSRNPSTGTSMAGSVEAPPPARTGTSTARPAGYTSRATQSGTASYATTARR